jgi:hypothetical protein
MKTYRPTLLIPLGLATLLAIGWLMRPAAPVPSESRSERDVTTRRPAGESFGKSEQSSPVDGSHPEPVAAEATETMVLSDVVSNLPEKASSSSTQDSFDLLMACLKKARAALDEIPAYRSVLEKQVRIDGKLRETQEIDIKVRHEPFSVFLKWREDQQEVLFVDGKNNGRLLVHPTRGIIALRKVWKLPPDSPQAMKSSRHPVTELGILRLYAMIAEFHDKRGNSTDGLECRAYRDFVGDIECLLIEVEFESPEHGGEFSRSIVAIDPRTHLIIGVENYGWTPDGKPAGLLERYFYHDLTIEPDLNDTDFDHKNPEYNFS